MFSFAKKLVDRLEGTSSHSEAEYNSYFKNGLQLNNKGYGLRVLNVAPQSTAHKHGFESWFDFIIRINNHELPMLNPSLSTYSYSINEDGSINYGGNATQEQVGAVNFDLLLKEITNIFKTEKTLVLDVWSAKGGVVRQIALPLTEFVAPEGETASDSTVQKLYTNNFASLGLTLESQHLSSATYVWRILASHPGSPAFVSQLIPYSDYIIGCDSAYPDEPDGRGLLAQGGESLLSRTVLSYYNSHYSLTQDDNIPITLYVYNHDYDILRPVTVNLSRSWGTGQNKGLLGCDVGYGLLHRIPEVVGKFENNELTDDVLFESNQNIGYDIPVTQSESPEVDNEKIINPMANAPPPFIPQANTTGPPVRSGASKKKKHPAANVAALDGLNDYMNEELAKSKEMDSQAANSASVDTLPPPPPKST
ncbi:GRASP55/65 PDZ-like domain-containing protein [Scheffersomyces xylosifermentans]|uniref:GRASP55/65 PDZ-like domain-containing protein n=1 Tax=Scheffersomyces xylosifermentans TaxID=1304137 RepID=UPI00315D674C